MSRLPVSLTLLAVLATAAFACGDGNGEGDALSTYFEQSLAISREVNDRIGELKQIYPNNYNDVADIADFDMQQTMDSYQDYVDLYTEFIDRTAALDPPEALRELHGRRLAVNRDLNAINEARLEQLLDADSLQDVEAVFQGGDAFVAAVEAAHEVCTEVRDLAEEDGLDWEEPCPLD